jgi:hypothetical protein
MTPKDVAAADALFKTAYTKCHEGPRTTAAPTGATNLTNNIDTPNVALTTKSDQHPNRRVPALSASLKKPGKAPAPPATPTTSARSVRHYDTN